MKTKLYLGTLLIALFGCTFIMSCSKDDDDDNNKTKELSIYSTWQREADPNLPTTFTFYKFSNDNTFTRVTVVEEGNDVKGYDSVAKEVKQGTISIDGNEMTMIENGSSEEQKYQFTLEEHWLTMKRLDSTGKVVETFKLNSIPASIFNQKANTNIKNPLNIHKQWYSEDVSVINPNLEKYGVNGIILDLTDLTDGYMLVRLKADYGKYKAGHWYELQTDKYNVVEKSLSTGTISYSMLSYDYVLYTTALKLTLVSKNLTAHYTAVTDIENEGKISL